MPKVLPSPDNLPDPQSVLLFHGRNDKAQLAFREFLRQLGLYVPDWQTLVHSTGIRAPFVGQVIEEALSRVGAVIVLLTPDDEARLRPVLQTQRDRENPEEAQLAGQPRANVIFEAGLAMGRCPERTIIVQLGQIRSISDLTGRHIVFVDDDTDWREHVVVALEAAGCTPRREGDRWREAGSFREALAVSSNTRASMDGVQHPAAPTTSKATSVRHAEAASLELASGLASLGMDQECEAIQHFETALVYDRHSSLDQGTAVDLRYLGIAHTKLAEKTEGIDSWFTSQKYLVEAFLLYRKTALLSQLREVLGDLIPVYRRLGYEQFYENCLKLGLPEWEAAKMCEAIHGTLNIGDTIVA